MGLFDRLTKWFQQPVLNDDALAQLKESLLLADAGNATTDAIVRYMKKNYPKDTPVTKDELTNQLLSWFESKHNARKMHQSDKSIYLIVGVNGVGKTTLIAKLAHYYQTQGQQVSLIAGDTFRAGAVEQLQTWGSRLGVDVYTGVPGSDPASVVYEGLKQSTSDVVLIDTAGRLQNKTNLMNELAKIKRVIQNVDVSAPQETLLVLDATTGQNGLTQADVFTKDIGVTGVVLNKWDGVAKGGFVLSIVDQLSLPIFFLGTGEQQTDLMPFDGNSFIQRLGESS
jgi:fused signal recognition particle receptor